MTGGRITIRESSGAPAERPRDRMWTYAIVGSLVLHLLGLGIIARTYAARMASPEAVRASRYIKVDLVDLPEDRPAARKSAAPRYTPPDRPLPVRPNVPVQSLRGFTPPRTSPVPHRPMPSASQARPSAPPRAQGDNPEPIRTVRVPGNPGGRLNTGTPSAHGDLGGSWTGGRTPVGWVSGDDSGRGKGSGSGIGVGAPDPPKHVDDGPGTRPAPPPLPAPPPPTVSVRVCVVSGDLPNDHCRNTRTETFVEGRQPSSRCARCKAPEPEHKSRLADRSEPELIRDSRPKIPDSVEEGLSVTVKVEYTITEDGDVTGVRVIRSSGSKVIDRAVVESASRLKYRPAVQDGVPRSVPRNRTYSINT